MKKGLYRLSMVFSALGFLCGVLYFIGSVTEIIGRLGDMKKLLGRLRIKA